MALPERGESLSLSIARFYSSQRFELFVLSIFGVIALAIAASGLYAVIVHRVAERTPELGIRLALGASQTSVQWLVLGRRRS